MEWISIKRELPPVNTPLLCYQRNEYRQFRQIVLGFDGVEFKEFYKGNNDDILFEDGNYPKISHWMLLPIKPINNSKNK